MSQESDTFTLSTAILDDVGNVIDYREWNLKVVGTYLFNGGNFAISNADGSSEVPIYMPLNTLQTIRKEAIDFQNQNNPNWLENIQMKGMISNVHPVMFEMHDLESAKNMIKNIRDLPEYQNGEIKIHSTLAEYVPVLSSIYSVTSSFGMLACIVAFITLLFTSVRVSIV